MLANQEIRVANRLDPDTLEHLADNDFNMLIVNLNTLKPVDLLDFIHEILLELLFAQHIQNVVGINRAVHERFTGLNFVSVQHIDVTPSGNQILPKVAVLIPDRQLTHALHDPAQLYASVDLGD